MGNQQSTVKEDDESEQPEPVHSQTKDLFKGSNNYNYNLKIEVRHDALKELKNSRVTLIVAKFIRGSEPLEDLTSTVWVASSDFSTSSLVSWKGEYEAYFIRDPKDGTSERITQPIKCGQTLLIGVENAEVTGEVSYGSNYIKIYNNSDSDVKAGLCQNVSFNNKDMGRCPITIQTVKAKSEESIFVEENIFVTCTPDNIESGDPVMDVTYYPAMEVDFRFDNQRKIYYYGKIKGRLFGIWNTESEDSWGIEHVVNYSLRETLRQLILRIPVY